MGHKLSARVWEFQLPYQYKFALLTLAHLADDTTGQGYVNIHTTIKLMGAGRSTIYRTIKGLEERKFIVVKRDKHRWMGRYSLPFAMDERAPEQ